MRITLEYGYRRRVPTVSFISGTTVVLLKGELTIGYSARISTTLISLCVIGDTGIGTITVAFCRARSLSVSVIILILYERRVKAVGGCGAQRKTYGQTFRRKNQFPRLSRIWLRVTSSTWDKWGIAVVGLCVIIGT